MTRSDNDLIVGSYLYLLYTSDDSPEDIKQQIATLDLRQCNKIVILITDGPMNINIAELLRPYINQFTHITLWYFFMKYQIYSIDILKEYNLNLHEFTRVKYFSMHIARKNSTIDCKLLPQSITHFINEIYYDNHINIVDINHLYRIRHIDEIDQCNIIGGTYLPNLLHHNADIYQNKYNACSCQSCLNRPYQFLNQNERIDLLLNKLSTLKQQIRC